MRFLFLVLVSIFCVVDIAFPQNSTDDVIREKFAFEVLHIDEFIERFNFDQRTKLLRYFKSEKIDESGIDRAFLITKLFKLNGLSEKDTLAKEFVKFVTDSTNPYYLSFYDKDWFAELDCEFEFNGEKVMVTLIMANQATMDSTSKWVIESVISEDLEFPESKDSNHILSPVSHGTDFAGLFNSLEDKENIRNFLANDFAAENLTYFATLLYYEQLKLLEISKIKYHFLQIPKWIFTVQYYNIKDLQSGWLINELYRVNRTEKEIFKKNYLELSNTALQYKLNKF